MQNPKGAPHDPAPEEAKGGNLGAGGVLEAASENLFLFSALPVVPVQQSALQGLTGSWDDGHPAIMAWALRPEFLK